METRLPHRDAAGGLFIGASKCSFALMNAAPAELLHLLAYAALQPFRLGRRSAAGSRAKKNAGDNAGVGILFQDRQTNLRRIRIHALAFRASGLLQRGAYRSSTVHQIFCQPFRFTPALQLAGRASKLVGPAFRLCPRDRGLHHRDPSILWRALMSQGFGPVPASTALITSATACLAS